ncbi:MAG: RnfABCDGE type electron transport complex subunit D [Candidatus Rokubacteria bacterium]|nr:RnfABCDGE type electron transport complex subunit D [Candidatus Rokubacteria bacterium]
MSGPSLLITASPHLAAGDSTPKIMWTVVASLVPLVAAAAYFFGPGALLVVVAATAGAVAAERVFGRRGTLGDGSAAITGILLGLTLPAGIPLWMACAGGAFGLAIGKLLFGGLGQNVFNPALLGRAFLQAAFPVAMTTWPMPAAAGDWWKLRGDSFAIPFASPRALDVVTGATPLGKMKFENEATRLLDLVLGTTPGSLGETSALLILICGGYLALRNYLNWRIPASIFATVGVLATGLHWLHPRYPDAAFMLFSGGLMLGAVYMATDLVTSPVTNPGCWMFGAGIGLLVVLIRIWGGLAEGVMYAILIMNAFVPYLNRWTQPRVFGTRRLTART